MRLTRILAAAVTVLAVMAGPVAAQEPEPHGCRVSADARDDQPGCDSPPVCDIPENTPEQTCVAGSEPAQDPQVEATVTESTPRTQLPRTGTNVTLTFVAAALILTGVACTRTAAALPLVPARSQHERDCRALR